MPMNLFLICFFLTQEQNGGLDSFPLMNKIIIWKLILSLTHFILLYNAIYLMTSVNVCDKKKN